MAVQIYGRLVVCSPIGHLRPRVREPEGGRRVSGCLLTHRFLSAHPSVIHDRGFESLKVGAASAALGFGGVFRVANAFRVCLLTHRSSMTEGSRA